MSRKMTRVALALLVLVTITAGAAPAAPRSLAEEPEASPLAALWERIVAWFEPVAVWTEGCSMDPNGRCRGGEIPEEGSGMDPHG